MAAGSREAWCPPPGKGWPDGFLQGEPTGARQSGQAIRRAGSNGHSSPQRSQR